MRSSKEGLLFLKKKKQKDFYLFNTSEITDAKLQRTEVLWFFLSRKNNTSPTSDKQLRLRGS